ncbi:MAG: hypothetical protein JXB32_24615 [Deltaproteobacteria bacterium]|nr:hypothetical protein [Deltaproteobacteria bacterium]
MTKNGRPFSSLPKSKTSQMLSWPILAGYAEADGNVVRLETLRKERGIRCSRRWLAVFLERWGVRPVRRRD